VQVDEMRKKARKTGLQKRAIDESACRDRRRENIILNFAFLVQGEKAKMKGESESEGPKDILKTVRTW